MLPEYPQFKPFSPADWHAVQEHLGLETRTICELSLTNFAIWREFDNSQLTLINGNLCVLINPLNEPGYFLEPLGNERLAETADICLKHTKRMSRLSHAFIEKLPEGRFRGVCLRDQFDYVYSVAEMAELKGKKFDGKRNHIRKFGRDFPAHRFARLDTSIRQDALKLFDKWYKIREESRFFPKMAYVAQRSALEAALLNFDKLKLIGCSVTVGDSLAGLLVGSVLNPEMIDLHLSYTDPEVPGVSQFMLQQACAQTYSSYKLINLEQDLGIPGLRKAKLSYHPLRLEKKFEITG